MLRNIITMIIQSSILSNILHVKYLFYKRKAELSSMLRLEENIVFKHACLTPLTTLDCSLGNLCNDSGLTKKQRVSLNAAISAKERLMDLIMSLTSNQGIRYFSVVRSLKEVADLFKIKQSISMEFTSLIDEEVKLKGNRLYFQEAIICMLNNSIEAYSSSQEKHISLVIRSVENYLLIDIVDYACGMSYLAQKLAQMEGISYKERGSGLGLCFTRKAIKEQFEGEMRMISGPDLGTRVVFKFPIPEPYNQNPLQS
jgi:signal transduction histidine kinase